MILTQAFLKHLKEQKRSIALFLSVGTLAALVNLGSFSFFWKFLHLDYKIAVSIAYILSVLVHFFANRQFTFKAHTTEVRHQLQRYIVMLGTNYLFTLLIVFFVVEILAFSPYAGIVCAIGFNVTINYMMSRFWIFQPS